MEPSICPEQVFIPFPTSDLMAEEKKAWIEG
jgi:hypothetical protein